MTTGWKCSECGRSNPATAAWCSRCCRMRDDAVIISAPGDPIRVAVQPPKAKRVEMVEWFRKRMAGRVSS